jgi:PPOX class probable F420-dependent enzyme
VVDPGRERYVSFTSFRRDGTPVATPVWIAPLGDGRVAFTTDPGSWKVKRVRANPAVELRPCTMSGAVAPDAPVVRGTAEVVTDPEPYAEVVGALRRKYGLQVALVELGGRIKQCLRRNPRPDCALVVTLD